MNNETTILLVGLIASTLRLATPLALAALGGVFSEKSGVVNIALEGIMIAGAFSAVLGSYLTGNPWIGVVFSMIGGTLFAALHAFLCINLQAEQVVSGVGINVFAAAFSSFLLYVFFGNPSQSSTVPALPYPKEFFLNLPLVGNTVIGIILGDLNYFVLFALILVLVSIFIFNKTSLGLRIRAVGEHPKAVDTLGISVYGLRYLSVIISGILGGLGGASISIGILSSFREGMISGRGYIALAAVIFGNWNPRNASIACLLFGFAEALQLTAQGFAFKLPQELYSAFPYLITMIVLIAVVGKTQGPAANGVPYKKGER